MALHVARHIIRQARKDAGYERPMVGANAAQEHRIDVADNEVKEGTEWHDAIAITLSVIMLGGVALGAEHFFALDGDVTYDVLACCAAHPVSRVIKAVLLVIL